MGELNKESNHNPAISQANISAPFRCNVCLCTKLLQHVQCPLRNYKGKTMVVLGQHFFGATQSAQLFLSSEPGIGQIVQLPVNTWNSGMACSTILNCNELLHTTKPGHILHFIFAICEVLFSSDHYTGHSTGLRQTLYVLLTQLANPFLTFECRAHSPTNALFYFKKH